MSYANQVVIGPEFFKKAFNDYTNWRWAIVREYMQNSIDAGSKNINVTIEKVPQGTRMIVKNDGAPMTKEILVNKLLSLGGSGKNFQGSVGGFGKAKEILYYAHKSYKIESGNHIVTGSGAGYDLAEQPHVNGTTSEVIIDGDWVSSLQTNVQSFAATAQWDGTLTCNGQELATNLRKGSPRRELDFGTVYTNKSFNKKLVVRIGGIPMFITYVDYPDCVLVELNGSSADVLASNRDVLRYPFCNQLDEFISEIAMNKRTAMKRRDRSDYRHYAGDRLAGRVKSFNVVSAVLPTVSSEAPVAPRVEAEASVPVEESGASAPVQARDPGLRPNVAEVMSHTQAVRSALSEEFVVKNNTCAEVPAYYLPDSGEFSSYSLKLVKIWSRLLVQLHTTFEVNSNFSVGFLFDESVEAERETHDDYGIVYYVSPAKWEKANWAKRFKLTDRGALIFLALHEFVHHYVERHDEDYAAKLTDMSAVVYEKRKDFTWCFNS